MLLTTIRNDGEKKFTNKQMKLIMQTKVKNRKRKEKNKIKLTLLFDWNFSGCFPVSGFEQPNF